MCKSINGDNKQQIRICVLLKFQAIIHNKMHQPYHLPILYSENCPQEPIIPHLTDKHPYILQEPDLEEQISRATRVIAQKGKSQTFYTPKIIKSKHPVHMSYEMIEHQRELISMQKRIDECKNVQQRKKDKNDPLLYPPYFIRKHVTAKDARVDGFSRKIVGSQIQQRRQRQQLSKSKYIKPIQKKEQKKQQPLRKYQYSMNVQFPNDCQSDEEQSSMPSPVFGQRQMGGVQSIHILRKKELSPINQYHNEEASQKNVYVKDEKSRIEGKKREERVNMINLPECDVKSVMDHIYNKKVYREQDLDVLKRRMLHGYGNQCLRVWQYVMHLLGRK